MSGESVSEKKKKNRKEKKKRRGVFLLTRNENAMTT